MNIKDLADKIKEYLLQIKLKKIFYAIGIAIAVLLVFQAGIFVGYRKAAFSYQWGETYYRTFGNKRGSFVGIPGIGREEFTAAHGAVGKIIKIDLPTFIIKGSDNVEKIVLIKDDTVVARFRETIKSSDLKEGDFVIVIGSPNSQSQIEARLIRLAPLSADSAEGTGAPVK